MNAHMNAHIDAPSLAWTWRAGCHRPASRPAPRIAGGVLSGIAKAGLASAGLLALLTVTGWMLTNPSLIPYLQALTWATGFALLGFAIDADEGAMGYLFVSGLTLSGLAVASTFVTPELVLIAIVPAAVWLAAWTWRR